MLPRERLSRFARLFAALDHYRYEDWLLIYVPGMSIDDISWKHTGCRSGNSMRTDLSSGLIVK